MKLTSLARLRFAPPLPFGRVRKALSLPKLGVQLISRAVRRTTRLRAMGTWYDKVRRPDSDASIVRDLVESVERLPGLDKWSPSHGFEIQRTELIRWGYALWMTRSLPGVESLQRTIAREILASGRPAPETLAELDGAALCVALGAVAAGRIPRGSDRTADWRMVWPGNANLDLEITIAKRK